MNRSLHQASCVALGGRAVLIEGPPGSGKSSLVLALVDRGAVMVGDDGVTLEARGDRLWALPPPRIEGLLEVRNVGLIAMPVTEAPVAIVIMLDREAPRLPEGALEARRGGCKIPAIALWPDTPVLALRAERALDVYGLR